ncbi:MAG: stalk domain-containing protein [Acidobacteriota bacterium]
MTTKKSNPVKALILALALLLLAVQPAMAIQFVVPGGSVLPTKIFPDAPTGVKASGKLDLVSGIYVKVAWTNPGSSDACFTIERKAGSGNYSEIGTTSNGIHEFKDKDNLAGNTSYTYRVRTVVQGSTPVYSAYSNEASFTLLGPPNGVTAGIDNSGYLNVNWQYSYNSTGIMFFVMVGNGQEWVPINQNTPSSTTSYKYNFGDVPPGTSYQVAVMAMNNNNSISQFSNIVSVTMPDLQQQSQQNQQQDPQQNQSQQSQSQQNQGQVQTSGNNPGTSSSKIVIQLFLGKKAFDVNGTVEQMDAAPISKWGRTLLPVKYVADALGADVQWDPTEKKATISMNGQTIEVWAGKNIARINGSNVVIDAQNPQVKGITVPPGRTMLPLRFIAENLGCDVQWDPNLQRATVTYPK